MAEVAYQGHLYQHGEAKVIALETGKSVEVGQIVDGEPWFVSFFTVSAEWLKPLPMVYHGGEVPRG